MNRTIKRKSRIKIKLASASIGAGAARSSQSVAAIDKLWESKIKQIFYIKALSSHLLSVDKFMVSGEHDNFKSWLVCHGNKQDSLQYPDCSSPTVSIHVIMMGLMMSAYSKGYILGKLDVKGDFIKMVHREKILWKMKNWQYLFQIYMWMI